MSTRLPEEIVPDNDQTRARREHLDRIRALVGNAYPNRFARSNVTDTPEGEDTISSLINDEALGAAVGDERFGEAFASLKNRVKAGERPTPDDLDPLNAGLSEFKVRVSGRLATPPRVMGKAAFVHLSDGKERLQIYVRRQEAKAISNDSLREVEEEESGWKLFQLLDHGDFVGVEGRLFVTKTGELSVHVETIQFLSKALLPMPDKLHGISDPEIRQRQRYADLIASSLKVKTDDEPEGSDSQPELSTREVFERRSKLVSAMRRHLDEHGYIEVETPMLSPIASGAAARPFVTHHNALDIDLFLRIAPELYLKRLLVGGFERVYELNRNFRNEGISTRHNPEFTMLEFYTAYKDVNWMMDFCEDMLRQTIVAIVGGTTATFGGIEIEFGRQFERLTMKSAISQHFADKFELLTGRKFDERTLDSLPHVSNISTVAFVLGDVELSEITKLVNGDINSLIINTGASISFGDLEYLIGALDGRYDFDDSQLWGLPEETQIAHYIARTFEHVAEQHLIQPTFIHDFPKDISPLSKASPDDPAIAERFELYVAGMEVANGFSELNDPAEQLERFEEQAGQRERGDEEAMQTDLDYVRALSYGMPPAAGIGIGIDRMTMLLTNRRSIRDVILFPHMRPRHAAEAQAQESEEESSDSQTPRPTP
jgi:lysyl-tRNA synthetase, class II